MREARSNHAGLFLAAWLSVVIIVSMVGAWGAFPDGASAFPAIGRQIYDLYSATQVFLVNAQMHAANLAPVLFTSGGFLILGLAYLRMTRQSGG